MVRSFFLTGRDYFDRTLRQGLRFRRASKLWPYAVTSPRLGFQRRPTGFGPIISPSPALLVLRPVRSYRQALAKALAVASSSWCWRGSASFIASTIFCSALSRHSAAVRRVTVLSLSECAEPLPWVCIQSAWRGVRSCTESGSSLRLVLSRRCSPHAQDCWHIDDVRAGTITIRPAPEPRRTVLVM